MPGVWPSEPPRAAVELMVAARPGSYAAEIDQALWQRGREPFYKASPRHRSRCTAY